MNQTTRMLRAKSVTVLTLGVLSTFTLTGCAPTFTCYDNRDCPPEGGVDAKSTPDAHSETSKAHHDGGTDGTTDGQMKEGGSGDGVAPGDGGGDVKGDGFTCDPTKTPSEDSCVITDALGVFVAPTGNDSGPGTMASPYKTVSEGITAAAGTKRVYVCGATYAESLVVNAGVQVYGGLACPVVDGGAGDAAIADAGGKPAWSYTGALAMIAPTAVGYALDVESVSSATFEDMGFTAQDAPVGTPGASSIAVLVNASTGVSFTRVSATAGAGAAGVGPAAPVTNWCAASLDGAGVSGGAGASSVSCTCVGFGSTYSGNGGNAGNMGGSGGSTPAATAMGLSDGSGGAAGSATVSCGNAHNGATGASGSAGTAGAIGSLGASGWTVSAGGAGAPGDPGEGGGGGGGSLAYGAASGGGGGCGGSAGTGGGGGGASIAFGVVGSSVIFTRVTIQTDAGGAGGAGAPGEAGQSGGAKGVDTGVADGCNGGNGGAGAGGSGGGGGAGGPSVGIAMTVATSSVTIDGTSETPPVMSLMSPSAFTPGGGGTSGAGGLAGAAAMGGSAGLAGLPGPAGTVAAVASF